MPSETVSFDRAVEYYDATRGFPPGVEADVARLFAQAGGLSQTSTVLEIGVGTGRIALPLAPYVGAYHGIDVSPGMLGKLTAKQRGERIFPVIGDATRLPYPDHTFDAAIAVHIFHLIPGWRESLKELTRVLKPNGLLLHGGSQRISGTELEEVWRVASGRAQERPDRAPVREAQQHIESVGWQHVPGDYALHYTQPNSPQQYLDSLRNRMWSHLWSMDEADILAGEQAVQAYIEAHYPDPNVPMPVEQVFRIHLYRPPAPTAP